jgi:hypothetical protein
MIFRCPFWFQKIFCTSGTVSGPSPRTLCSLEISELLRWRSLEISELLRWRSLEISELDRPMYHQSASSQKNVEERVTIHPFVHHTDHRSGRSESPSATATDGLHVWPGCKCAAASGSDGDLAERAIARLREEIRIPVCRSDTRHP